MPPSTEINALLSRVPMLDDTNYVSWSKKIAMVFVSYGIEGIDSSDAPTETAALKERSTLDRRLVTIISTKVSDLYLYLVEDLRSAKSAWNALSKHFNWSTIGCRIAACSEPYSIIHNPDQPIEFYLNALQKCCSKLEALNVKVEDQEFKVKDLLIMHLDPSFNHICLNILALTDEPTLDSIKLMLISSTGIDQHAIKTEPMDIVMAARGRHHTHEDGGSSAPRTGTMDSAGFIWCNQPTDD
ncbi:hypothetical protein DXG01_016201 [Tephrocybe rancida]|nr:hypothetical protein DXG01_016201 [Tephrocybe rancida]